MWRIITCVILLACSTIIYCGNENPLEKGNHQPCGTNSTNASGSFSLNASNFTGVCVWYFAPTLNSTNKTATTSLFIQILYLHENDKVTLFKNEADVGNSSLSIINPLTVQNGSVTIFTMEPELFIKLEGDPKAQYTRKFGGLFHGFDCAYPISDAVHMIHSPIHTNVTESFSCKYIYNQDQHMRIIQSFSFEDFNMASSVVNLKGSTIDGPYHNVPAMDFFPQGHGPMEIDVDMTVPSNDSFRLRMHTIDKTCYLYKKFDSHDEKITVDSPENIFNNGSIEVMECRWIFEHSDSSKSLGVTFDKLYFDNPLDIIAINDGASEFSSPLLQVTASNSNITKNQMIRSTGPLLWMAFKPSTYASLLTATVGVHGQGGYHKGSGNISVTLGNSDDPVFLLEVEAGQIVLLKFHDSDFPLPATLSVYDGFDKTNLLATLHGNVWYPVLSKSNKMMLIASNFAKGKFSAEFEGVSASCLHMSTFSNENYVLTGNCNNTCLWVVPPQDQNNTDLLLNLQFLALAKDDQIKIWKLDAAKTVLGTVSSSMNHVPQFMIPANIGALVEITRAPCAKENSDVVVVGHSSYLPSCGKDMSLASLDSFQISSPLHPDTYPVFAACRWKISTAKDNLVLLAFHSLNLAPNHCVTITQSTNNKTEIYDGSNLREDLFLIGETVVEFDSENCKKSKDPLPLASSEGFVLNGTVTDCGSVFTGKASGSFSVPANKSLCIWKFSIPETEHDTSNVVNIISYSVTKHDESGNYELLVYDGNSVRDKKILNSTNWNIWSRTNNLIFIYKKIIASKPSSILTIKFDTISCNATMQCDNRMCMHPDWRCNGNNDCGDFSDERNCNAVPIPPTIELTGYSSSAFWGTIFAMLVLGAAMGVGVPFCYQKYKNGQYRRFGEISIIE